LPPVARRISVDAAAESRITPITDANDECGCQQLRTTHSSNIQRTENHTHSSKDVEKDGLIGAEALPEMTQGGPTARWWLLLRHIIMSS